jgi:hypothetical protein
LKNELAKHEAQTPVDDGRHETITAANFSGRLFHTIVEVMIGINVKNLNTKSRSFFRTWYNFGIFMKSWLSWLCAVREFLQNRTSK